jgi:Flp pilus assembly protein TadG
MKKRTIVRGQSLVEFGFSIVLLLVILFGVFDLGRAFWVKIVITNSAREGARYLTRHPGDREGGYSETKDAVIQEAENSGVSITADEISVFCGGGTKCTEGGTALVTVTKQFEFNLLNMFGPIELQETTKMVVP